jgi:hypothetical protein
VGPNGRLVGSVESLCAQDPDIPHGAHSFGIPGIDTFVPPGSNQVLKSSMNLSVAAIGVLPATPGHDVFTLHGVLSGGAYTGATLVGLYFTHQQQSFFMALPNRPAGGQPYPFTITPPINIPWSGPGINEYDVLLLTAPVSGPGFAVSTRAQLRRTEN